MGIKGRLLQFIAYKGLTNKSFETKCGLGNGFVSKVGDSIRKEKLDKISNTFPELNIDWIINEKGEMLKTVHQTASGNGNTQVAGNGNTVTHTDMALTKALDELAEQRRLVSKAQEQIDRLIGLLEKK